MDSVLSINTLAYEGYDLATALEEIVKTGAELIRSIGSDFIKLNYDFGNAFTYSKGPVDPAAIIRKPYPMPAICI